MRTVRPRDPKAVEAATKRLKALLDRPAKPHPLDRELPDYVPLPEEDEDVVAEGFDDQ